ncbi:hypothetical protein [Anaerofustis stercorihominis]|uniref:hypothetical protein n=1 Tax=Anaerofustis stercorihominis TaxID=214853 RepID=UPI0026728C8E|nr:hypothetical protein [Anaerofustis stercorihominis]
MYMEKDKEEREERDIIFECVEEITNILEKYEISISEKDSILRIVNERINDKTMITKH